MKPFDLEEAKAGKPICTRNGAPARIIYDNAKGNHPIIALIEDEEGECEMSRDYTIDGFFNNPNIPSDSDLMMVGDKRKGWVNISKRNPNINPTDRIAGYIYRTREEAQNVIKTCSSDYLDTIEIEWEE